MNLEDVLEIYQLISEGTANAADRKQSVASRKNSLSQVTGFSKVAFDTRRINQDTQYNPRRNLQYYLREQSFIDEKDEAAIKSLAKLKGVVNSIKDEFLGEPEWFDSYAYDLDHQLEKIFYVADGKNFDFSVTALQHLEQVLQARYRLSLTEIDDSDETDLRKLIVRKDERLEKSSIYQSPGLSKINKIENTPKPLPKPKTVKNSEYKKIADMLSGIIGNMFTDEQRLEELNLEESNLNNELHNKKFALGMVRQDKDSLRKTIIEKSAKEQILLQKLWANYNSIKKLNEEKQKIEGVIATEVLKKVSQNSDQQGLKEIDEYKKEAQRVIDKKMIDMRTFNSNMLKDRPIYDTIHAERLAAEKVLKEKITDEKAGLKDITELEVKVGIQLDKVSSERDVIKTRMKDNLAKMNELRLIEVK